ncbi:HU family DNA-binding protein [Cellulomonas humilata]|uniref:HU family DNA-binding protein n=1 Tax=Cellulomonas humilata TaxID=144055 RepID=A0A7Y5ZYR7_9CELL|nr:HU family DNA-binding protein [Cellulomonas humilata]NUU16460.1 HU family DNA-binding protein [Cellulomonas humilata]
MTGKSQIADRIAARGASRPAAAAAVDAVLGEITSALAAGERVTLTGFGTFEAAGRAARTARNPRTGEALEVAATTVARFHPGATLRARVAGEPGAPLEAVVDLDSLRGLAAPEPTHVDAPTPAKSAGVPSVKAAATEKAKAKAKAKKADVKKRADAAKKADAKKRADAKKAEAKKAQAKKKTSSGKGKGKKK